VKSWRWWRESKPPAASVTSPSMPRRCPHNQNAQVSLKGVQNVMACRFANRPPPSQHAVHVQARQWYNGKVAAVERVAA